jgi:hypothetical protein
LASTNAEIRPNQSRVRISQPFSLSSSSVFMADVLMYREPPVYPVAELAHDSDRCCDGPDHYLPNIRMP